MDYRDRGRQRAAGRRDGLEARGAGTLGLQSCLTAGAENAGVEQGGEP
jgi:hypothetical protein